MGHQSGSLRQYADRRLTRILREEAPAARVERRKGTLMAGRLQCAAQRNLGNRPGRKTSDSTQESLEAAQAATSISPEQDGPLDAFRMVGERAQRDQTSKGGGKDVEGAVPLSVGDGQEIADQSRKARSCRSGASRGLRVMAAIVEQHTAKVVSQQPREQAEQLAIARDAVQKIERSAPALFSSAQCSAV